MKKYIHFFIAPSLFIAILIGTLQIGSEVQAITKTKTTTTKTVTVKAVTSKPVVKKKLTTIKVAWTAGALKELNKVPRFVRPTVKAKITNYAKAHNIKTITAAIYKSIRV
jgi:hypothetical protein